MRILTRSQYVSPSPDPDADPNLHPNPDPDPDPIPIPIPDPVPNPNPNPNPNPIPNQATLRECKAGAEPTTPSKGAAKASARQLEGWWGLEEGPRSRKSATKPAKPPDTPGGLALTLTLALALPLTLTLALTLTLT